MVQLQAQEDLSKQLLNMKNLLFGTDSNTAGATAHSSSNTESNQSDIVLAQLSQVNISKIYLVFPK